jgi:hypothetical protein
MEEIVDRNLDLFQAFALDCMNLQEEPARKEARV